MDAPTRERVARTILELGPSTAAVLAERLDLTPAAVRRHLDQMLAEGAVEAREPRVYGARGRGRPAKVFAITETGRDRFDQQYDDLAVEALRFLEETGGDAAVLAFARRRVAGIETHYDEIVAAEPGPRAVPGPGPGADPGWLRCLGPAGPGRRAAVPAALPGLARRPRVPAALRGGDRGHLQGPRPPRPAAGHHRSRRRGVHHLHPGHPTTHPSPSPAHERLTS